MNSGRRSTPRSLRMVSLEIAARSSVRLVTGMIRRLTPNSVDSVLHEGVQLLETALSSGAIEAWVRTFMEEIRERAQDDRWLRRIQARFARGLSENVLPKDADARVVEIVTTARALSGTYRIGGLYIATLPHRPKDQEPSSVLLEMHRRELRAAAAVRAMASARGEARARAALEAGRYVVESNYRSYLEVLVRLKRLEKKNLNLDLFQSDVGPIADEAYARFPSCVDRGLVELRNADAHIHYEYLPKSDTIRWSNTKRRHGTVVAGPDVSVDDLVARVQDAYGLASGAVFTLRRDLTFAMFREARLDDLLLDVLGRWARGEADWEDQAREAARGFIRVVVPGVAKPRERRAEVTSAIEVSGTSDA